MGDEQRAADEDVHGRAKVLHEGEEHHARMAAARCWRERALVLRNVVKVRLNGKQMPSTPRKINKYG